MKTKELKNLKIFKWVEDTAVDDVLKNSETEFFPDGRLIIYEGERIDNKGYIIVSGSVSICIQKTLITELWVWEIFGEIWLILGDKRQATVRASQDTEVIVIDFDKLMMLIEHDENKINKEVIRRMEQNVMSD